MPAMDPIIPVPTRLSIRVIVAVCVTTILLVLGMWVLVRKGWLGYTASRFHGDGRLTDSTSSSYPRYSVSFDEISLGKTRTHSWTFSGLPATSMTFGIRS